MNNYFECRCRDCFSKNQISLDEWEYNTGSCHECGSTYLYLEDEEYDFTKEIICNRNELAYAC